MYQKFINTLYISFIIILISFSARSAEDLKSIGKFKDWETFTVTENNIAKFVLPNLFQY